MNDRDLVTNNLMIEAREYVDDYNIEPGDDEEVDACLESRYEERAQIKEKLDVVEVQVAQERGKLFKGGLKERLQHREKLMNEYDDLTAHIRAFKEKGRKIGADEVVKKYDHMR